MQYLSSVNVMQQSLPTGVQFRPARRLLPPIAWRHRIPQHLADRLASQLELPGRFAFTHFVDDDRSPNTRIQLHCVHLSGVPQNISLWECSMEPVFGGLVLLRRKTPLTRRLLVYFRSGAYRRRLKGYAAIGYVIEQETPPPSPSLGAHP